MRSCPGCGLSLDDDAVFCATCGWPKAVVTGQATPVDAGAASGSPSPDRNPAALASITSPNLRSDASPGRLALAVAMAVTMYASWAAALVVAFPHGRRYARIMGAAWTTTPRLLIAACIIAVGLGAYGLSYVIYPNAARTVSDRQKMASLHSVLIKVIIGALVAYIAIRAFVRM
jgi:hypothetical protein